ncbi:Ribonuclease H protein [Melia azedarach]|uniref:Ribonuclease H protein n=1 Tax=Melia azedarach TaxID=155640 RepID=A0ACC1Y1Z8_MELAZ|nr:Ribonuclease H protein [Melia azedarach]
MSCKSYLRSWSSSCPGSIYSISDLRILKAIGISANNCRAPQITQVLWLLPIYPFIKVNTDGLSKGNPGEAACGGVFRDHSGKFLGAYAVSLGHNTSFYAEIMAIIYAINQAAQRGWKFIWLESDSQAALSCLLDHSYKPPWCIYNEWTNCHLLLSQISFYCSHIFREGNQVADSMANVGLSCPTFTWFAYPPAQIKEILFKNRWGFPNFRFIKVDSASLAASAILDDSAILLLLGRLCIAATVLHLFAVAESCYASPLLLAV